MLRTEKVHNQHTHNVDNDRNFAGIVGPLQNTWETELSGWKRVQEINSVGVWLCDKHELKQMLKQDSIAVLVVLVMIQAPSDLCLVRTVDQRSRAPSSIVHLSIPSKPLRGHQDTPVRSTRWSALRKL